MSDRDTQRSLRHHVTEDDPAAVYNIRVETLSDRDAAVAAATLLTNNPFNPAVIATGSSKRLPGDPFELAQGEQRAIGRALLALGQSLIDVADAQLPD